MKGAQCIWIISKYASSREYGFETRFFALAREIVKTGRKVVIVTSDSHLGTTYPPATERVTRETIGGIIVRRLRTLKYHRTASVRRVLTWLDFEWQLLRMPRGDLPRPDVIVASSLSLLTVLNGLWLRSRYRCKLIFEVRDIWPLTLIVEGGFSRWHPLVLLLGWIERIGYRHADLVLGTMPNLGEHVANIAGPDVRTACVPFGCDPAAYQATQPDPEADRAVPAGKFVVAYAGSIGVTNALDTVMACVHALKDDPRIFFLFLGDGDRRERYMNETRGLPNVRFVGRVERAKVAGWLQRADLLYFAAHPSAVWRYGHSMNKFIDYMMSAKPILGSYTGHESMLGAAGCGEVVPAGDVDALREALLRSAAMPRARLEEMGKAGRSWLMAHRPWSVLAQDFLKICDDLVG